MSGWDAFANGLTSGYNFGRMVKENMQKDEDREKQLAKEQAWEEQRDALNKKLDGGGAKDQGATKEEAIPAVSPTQMPSYTPEDESDKSYREYTEAQESKARGQQAKQAVPTQSAQQDPKEGGDTASAQVPKALPTPASPQGGGKGPAPMPSPMQPPMGGQAPAPAPSPMQPSSGGQAIAPAPSPMGGQAPAPAPAPSPMAPQGGQAIPTAQQAPATPQMSAHANAISQQLKNYGALDRVQATNTVYQNNMDAARMALNHASSPEEYTKYLQMYNQAKSNLAMNKWVSDLAAGDQKAVDKIVNFYNATSGEVELKPNDDGSYRVVNKQTGQVMQDRYAPSAQDLIQVVQDYQRYQNYFATGDIDAYNDSVKKEADTKGAQIKNHADVAKMYKDEDDSNRNWEALRVNASQQHVVSSGGGGGSGDAKYEEMGQTKNGGTIYNVKSKDGRTLGTRIESQDGQVINMPPNWTEDTFTDAQSAVNGYNKKNGANLSLLSVETNSGSTAMVAVDLEKGVGASVGPNGSVGEIKKLSEQELRLFAPSPNHPTTEGGVQHHVVKSYTHTPARDPAPMAKARAVADQAADVVRNVYRPGRNALSTYKSEPSRTAGSDSSPKQKPSGGKKASAPSSKAIPSKGASKSEAPKEEIKKSAEDAPKPPKALGNKPHGSRKKSQYMNNLRKRARERGEDRRLEEETKKAMKAQHKAEMRDAYEAQEAYYRNKEREDEEYYQARDKGLISEYKRHAAEMEDAKAAEKEYKDGKRALRERDKKHKPSRHKLEIHRMQLVKNKNR